jgi:hypothetical protein
VSIVHSDDDRVAADPLSLAAAKCPSITERRRSAKRSIVTGSEEAMNGTLRTAGSDSSMPSSETARSCVCG